MFGHPIHTTERVPKRMASENVVLLSVSEGRRNRSALSGPQWPMMEKRLFPERACIPSNHAGGCNGHPIDSASPAWHISANFFEALAPKDLTLSGNIRLSFEAVGPGIVS